MAVDQRRPADGPTLLVASADPERLTQRVAELTDTPVEQVGGWPVIRGVIAFGDAMIAFNVGQLDNHSGPSQRSDVHALLTGWPLAMS
ncbi:hypothetical protein [Ilumatobacter sp.]|uniref:hypothetical protein n=1 Tax=Ilumatobacter sp. TaxID=1967498 RepID=UPI003750E8F8